MAPFPETSTTPSILHQHKSCAALSVSNTDYSSSKKKERREKRAMMIPTRTVVQLATAACLSFGATTAFTVTSISNPLSQSVWPLASSSSIAPDQTTPDGAAIMKELGIQEGKLAYGVKPSEIQKYIGTRQELIEKTLTDIPKFDRETAEKEVDKFLMDAEMVNMYIRYQKEVEKDPNFTVPNVEKENELFSLRNILLLYVAYVAATSGPEALRNFVADQELAGTWHDTGIAALDQWLHDTTSAGALTRAAEATSL